MPCSSSYGKRSSVLGRSLQGSTRTRQHTINPTSILTPSFGKRIAGNRKVMRLTAAIRYVGTAPTPSIGRYMHFPTRGVVFLIAVFWTFVLGQSQQNVSHTESPTELTSRADSLDLCRHALLPIPLERR